MKLGKVTRYQINIEPTLNLGFLVNIGCVRLAFHDKKVMLAALAAYLDNPEKFEKEYNSADNRAKFDSPRQLKT